MADLQRVLQFPARIGYHAVASSKVHGPNMSGAVSLVELPFLAAFLVFVFRFYNHDGASSMLAPSFLLASLTMLLALCFVALGIFATVPIYGIYGFAIAGIALFVLAITQILRL